MQYIKQARSFAAEWALVNEQVAEGKLTDVYATSMHRWLRQQLQTTSTSLTQPSSTYGAEIAALLRTPHDAPPPQLRVHSDRLKQIEDGLESA